MQNILLIAVFGAVGVLCRYGIDRWLQVANLNFPVSTLFINSIGCFIAGLLYVFSQRQQIQISMQTVLLVGFCGGFTTFSAYALQTVLMIEKDKFFSAVIYFSLSPVIGLIAASIPIVIYKKFLN